MRQQLRAAIAAEAHRKTLASTKTTVRPNLRNSSETCSSHKMRLKSQNLKNDVHKFIGAETGVECDIKTKSGECGLPVFAESQVSKSLSKVSDNNLHDNLQRYSQDEPECFTQLSELAILTAPRPRRSEQKQFSPMRYSDRDFEISEENFTRLDSEKEISINLDSQCPMWSHRKKLFSAATEINKVGSKRVAKKPSLSREEISRNEDGDDLVNPGVATTQNQSSSPFTVVNGPPRFSQLLMQASQSDPRPPKATQTTIREMGKRKSGVLHPAKSSKTAVTAQDDGQGATFGKANLREQILACLLEPDFEDFVAEVEKVWDEIQESVSHNLESQVLANRLEQGAPYPLSQSQSNWR